MQKKKKYKAKQSLRDPDVATFLKISKHFQKLRFLIFAIFIPVSRHVKHVVIIITLGVVFGRVWSILSWVSVSGLSALGEDISSGCDMKFLIIKIKFYQFEKSSR